MNAPQSKGARNVVLFVEWYSFAFSVGRAYSRAGTSVVSPYQTLPLPSWSPSPGCFLTVWDPA